MTTMITYRLIDTDTRQIVATAESLAAVLAHTPYMPTDCGAESWDAVAADCERHADGVAGVVEGYTVERIEGDGAAGSEADTES